MRRSLSDLLQGLICLALALFAAGLADALAVQRAAGLVVLVAVFSVTMLVASLAREWRRRSSRRRRLVGTG